MDYTVVIEWSTHDLAREVKRLLQDGWELQGGVSVTYDAEEQDDGEPFGLTYTQALVRRK